MMHYAVPVATALAILSFFGACNPSPENTPSELRIAGGTVTSAYSGVIRFLTDVKGGRFCTGVVVSDSTALLAGHCIKSLGDTSYIYAELPEGRADPIKSDKVYFWLALGDADRLDERTIARDLAVVAFAGEPFKPYEKVKISPRALEGQNTKSGSVTLVGYGANVLGDTRGARDSLGIKRVGKNTIFKAENGTYQIRSLVKDIGTDHHAVAVSGDAGAPLFDADGYLIGIGAGLLLTDAEGRPTQVTKDSFGYDTYSALQAVHAANAFVDLSSEASLKLLRYASWMGRSGQGHVKIPGVSVEGPVALTDEDELFANVSPELRRSGVWLSMVGGGGIFRDQKALALQGYASCSVNGQTQQQYSPSGNASVSCGDGGSGGFSNTMPGMGPLMGKDPVADGGAGPGALGTPSAGAFFPAMPSWALQFQNFFAVPPPPPPQFPPVAQTFDPWPGFPSVSTSNSGAFAGIGNSTSGPGMFGGPGSLFTCQFFGGNPFFCQ